MRRIFFDTNPFVYLVEDPGELGKRVKALVERMSERGDLLLTSTMTLGEVLVKPLAAGDVAWANKFERLLSAPGVTVVTFDRECARIFARIRQDKTVKPADAIQLACAASAKCDLFITNDDRLSRKNVPGIQFITSVDRAFI